MEEVGFTREITSGFFVGDSWLLPTPGSEFKARLATGSFLDSVIPLCFASEEAPMPP